MSKFTIDLEENKILFHEPFTKSDLEEVINLLNINGVEDWKIDMSDDYKPDPLPYIPPNDNTGTGWWQNPYIITSTGSEPLYYNDNNTSTTNTLLDTIYSLTTN